MPFACSGGVVAEVAICMQTPSLVSVTALTATTEAGDAVGNIDDTSNMADDKIYIFDGKLDSVVRPSIYDPTQSKSYLRVACVNSEDWGEPVVTYSLTRVITVRVQFEEAHFWLLLHPPY